MNIIPSITLPLVLILTLHSGAWYFQQNHNLSSTQLPSINLENSIVKPDYESTKQSVKTKKSQLSTQFKNTHSKQSVLIESREYLITILSTQVFPAWYGTRWGFYGMSRVPQQGEIACGTFVVFTLQDVGFDIPTRMAAEPSENIIKNLIEEKYIKRFPNQVPMASIVDYLKSQGEGLYLVGLDNHVGFIVYRNNDMQFVHSNYYKDYNQVVSQPILAHSPLVNSKYRIIGKLLNDKMLEKWLTNQTFNLRYRLK